MSSNYRSHLSNAYTAELMAIISRANSLGYTLPNSAKLHHCDTLIKAMKSDGSWSTSDIFFNFAFNDTGLSDFSRINWKNPSGTLATFNGGLTYQTTGIKGDATSGYCETGYLPNGSGNYTLNNAGRMFVVSVARTTGGHFDGDASGTLNNGMQCFSSTASRINSTNALAVAVDTSGTGLKAIMRDSSTNVRVVNAAVATSTTQTSVALPNNSQKILRGLTSQYSNPGIACYWMGASITSTQIQNYRTYYNTFLTAMGLSAVA